MQNRLKLRRHAHERRFKRDIRRDEIREVLENGEVIEERPEATPFPKYTMLGWTRYGSRPLHVVAADDEEKDVTYVLTVYEPDPDLWTDDFREKRD
ncbi:MAG: hypothetical protein BRD43_00270 [Bacteroidetes bacterium QS_4_64_154]|nr:MAG: hypothetical protein BRD43_00270 [Bacteroidetes bacterium QS_4_64_154]